MFLVIVLYLLQASLYTSGKAILNYAEPLFYISVRLIGSGLILALWVLYKNHRKDYCFDRKDLWLFMQSILFHGVINWACFFWALDRITSIEASLVYNLGPFIAALFSYFWFSEKLTIKKTLIIFLGMSSLIPILYSHALNGQFSWMHIIPTLVMALAVTSSTYGWVVFRVLVKDKKYSPVTVNATRMIGGGIVILFLSLLTEFHGQPVVTQWPQFVSLLAFTIVVGNVIMANLQGYLLKAYTVTLIIFASFMRPIFVAILSSWTLGEKVQWYFYVSLALIITSLYLFYREEKEQGYISSL